MISISFDNPYLLLIAIPLLALVIVPYLIAIRKENKSKSTVISLILHTVMIALVALALAGMHKTTVKTETEVYVVADVSHSTNQSLGTIDEYIQNIKKEENLPENSYVGVVCFGRDYKLNTPLGEQFTTVKASEVDTSATDINSALDYTATLFSKDAIKRIVLITDGKQTLSKQAGSLASTINSLEARNIYVDAIYIDSNLKPGEKEVQISSVEYNPSTYMNKENTLKVLIQSNTEYIPNADNAKDKNDAFIRLYDGDGTLKAEVSKPLQKGFNSIVIDLDTSVAGVTDYTLVIEANHDTNTENNKLTFTQTVNEKIKVLLVSETKSDLDKAESLYGNDAEIYAPLLLRRKEPVPYSLEELCKYDEYIISDIDVKTIANATAFMTNIDIAVSKFGKSLITAGNTFVQNQDDEFYKSFEDLMAVNYGNTQDEAKLYCILIDSSRSMQDASQLIMAKEAAIQLLSLMSPSDSVMVISFSGDVCLELGVTQVADRDTIIGTINSIKPTQGTVLGAGLRAAYNQMVDQPFYEKRVLLISDGRSYVSSTESDNPLQAATDLYKKGIITSVINTNSPVGEPLLNRIKNAGRGQYYFITSPESVKDIVSTDIADDLTETVIEKDTKVVIEKYDDPLVKGVTELPNIGGFYYCQAKPSSDATVVLSAEYRKSINNTVYVPIYTYWSYGNGKVTSISTAFSGAWVANWENDENAKTVSKNILTSNMPKERIDYPFNIEISTDETETTIEVLPGEINPDIFVDMEIISPSGNSQSTRIYYDAGSYFYSLHTGEVGKYTVNVSYVFGEETFDAQASFDVSYLPEYDSFELFDSSSLYASIGNSGSVSENGELKIENDENEVESYIYYYTASLMIAAVILYVIDIIIRKLKWSDIKSFFKKSKSGGKAQ